MNNQNNQYPLGGYNQNQGGYNQNQYYQQGMPIGNMNQPQGHSGLSIAAFICALLGCTSVIGFVLGVVDLIVNRRRKHGLSIAAIIIASFWIIIAIVVNATSLSTLSSKKIDSKPPVSSTEITEEPSETPSETDEQSTEQSSESSNATSDKTIYHIGDVIDVKTDNGEYKLCITKVTETDERNEFSDTQADRVVIIDYEFENVDYNVEFGDYKNNQLSISDFDFNMYDADGNVLKTYPASTDYAQAVSPGHKSSGQMAYALNNSTNYIEAEYSDNIFMSSDFTIELEW